MATKKVIELEAKADKAIGEIEELRKEIEKLNDEVVSANKKTEDSLKGVEDASKATAKGLRGIGTAIKAIGIGLLLEAFNFFKETIGENQKAVDFFATTFETLSLAFNDFINFVSDNFSTVTGFFRELFVDPVGSIKEFGTTLKNAIISRVKQAIEAFGLLGKAVGQFFAGNFAGAMSTAKQAATEFFDVVTGEEGGLESLTNTVKKTVGAITNYTKSTIDAAKANVELNKQAEVARVLQQGLVETYDRQAEKLRQIRDEERNTIAERIKANNDLKAVLDEQETAMLKQVDTQIASAQAAYDKNQNQENYIALLEATQEREAVLAQIEGFRSEQLSNDLALQREALELDESISEARNERAISEAEFLADQIEGEYLRLEAQRFVAEEEARLEEERLTKKRDQYKQGTQAYVDANNELLGFQQENNQKQLELDRQLQLSKQQLVGDALSNIIGIVGQNSKFGKAIAIVQAIRNTYQGATKALAELPPPFNFVAAAATVAAGFANVKQITSTQEPQAPSFAGSRGSGGGAASVAVPTPPQINTVGAAGVNQLAETINAQTKKPIKAFVVSGEVTTAQSLERNAVKEASI
jgi:hypothetical protein